MNFFGIGNKDKINILGVINFARFLFVALIVFEILNFLKILQFNTQFTWLGLVITSIFTLAVLEMTAHNYRKKKGHYLHWSVWVIITIALALDAAGDFFHLYSRYDWWDQVVHYFNSAIICFTLFAVINAFYIDKFKFSLLLKEGRLKLALFLATTATVSLGALYEMEEYLEDVFFHTNRLGSGADTANDLTLDILGAVTVVAIVSVYYFITHKRKIID
ncbi:MAG: hypothetical protein PHF50_02650 [Patescibacteria group bacterium]|nr:hypothetical protein [Patescibacteria group bacterium]